VSRLADCVVFLRSRPMPPHRSMGCHLRQDLPATLCRVTMEMRFWMQLRNIRSRRFYLFHRWSSRCPCYQNAQAQLWHLCVRFSVAERRLHIISRNSCMTFFIQMLASTRSLECRNAAGFADSNIQRKTIPVVLVGHLRGSPSSKYSLYPFPIQTSKANQIPEL
jgi:hypothetical protein